MRASETHTANVMLLEREQASFAMVELIGLSPIIFCFMKFRSISAMPVSYLGAGIAFLAVTFCQSS